MKLIKCLTKSNMVIKITTTKQLKKRFTYKNETLSNAIIISTFLRKKSETDLLLTVVLLSNYYENDTRN